MRMQLITNEQRAVMLGNERLERDRYFRPSRTLDQYSGEAGRLGDIQA